MLRASYAFSKVGLQEKKKTERQLEKTKRRYNKQVLLASNQTELQVRCILGLILEHRVAQAGMIGSQSTEAVLVPIGFMSFLKKKKGLVSIRNLKAKNDKQKNKLIFLYRCFR